MYLTKFWVIAGMWVLLRLPGGGGGDPWPSLRGGWFTLVGCIVGSRGASQLGGSLLGIPLGYKANKL